MNVHELQTFSDSGTMSLTVSLVLLSPFITRTGKPDPRATPLRAQYCAEVVHKHKR